MLTLKPAFARLMNLLRSIIPGVPLPPALEPYLWENMDEEFQSANGVLVKQGERPKKAYFIVRGFIHLYYYDNDGNKHVTRIYREGEIVALASFLDQLKSPYYIESNKDALLISVSNGHMEEIYRDMDGMKEFAYRTAMGYDDRKEKMRNEMNSKSGEERVLLFYTTFKDLLHTRIMKDAEVASYLLMTRETLCVQRSALLKKNALAQQKVKKELEL